MSDLTPVKILVVDDLADRLLVYRTVLEEPAQEVVCARSGSEALQHVLREDFAVILLDVNMPDMSGFETAGLIRSRRRSAHTPIIFITAFADELHALEGYSYGAVDYILSPVAPDILRTKVRVFVQLFRLNVEVQRRAELEVARAEHQHAQLAQILESANDLYARADVNGKIVHMNRSGQQMLGLESVRQPLAKLHLDAILASPPESDSASAQDVRKSESWIDMAAREGVVFGESSTRNFLGEEIHLSHVLLAHYKHAGENIGRSNSRTDSPPSALREVEAYSLIARDINDKKRAEAALALYRTQLERLVRERTAALEASQERLRVADRLASIGTLAAGLGHDMGNLILPIRLRVDSIERGLKAGQNAAQESLMGDVSAIRTACEYLQRLSRGLRLFSLDPDEDDGSERTTNLSAWWLNVEPFLRSALPAGVNLQRTVTEPPLDVIAPADASAESGVTEAWSKLPALAMPSHRFTQAIYNVLQNAGDAMRERRQGTVTISAQLTSTGARDSSHFADSPENGDTRSESDSQSAVVVSITDDGPGMDEDVRNRCMEPFFTTKTRGISTGLGLALVHGAVGKAGGSIEIRTRLGAGTTFCLTLPIAAQGQNRVADRIDVASAGSRAKPAALVNLGDARMTAYASTMLRAGGLDVVKSSIPDVMNDPGPVGYLVVTDRLATEMTASIAQFLGNAAERRVLIVGEAPVGLRSGQVFSMSAQAPPSQIRAAIERMVSGSSNGRRALESEDAGSVGFNGQAGVAAVAPRRPAVQEVPH